MKKTLFTFLILLFIINYSKAQSFDARFIIGASASQIDGDAYAGYDNAGFIIGGATSFLLGKNLRLHQEMSYYQRGSRISQQEFKNGVTPFIIKLDYLDMGLLASYTMNNSFLFEGGLINGFLLNAKTDFNGYGFQNANEHFNSRDLVMVVGVGYAPTPEWSFVARYLYSLSSVGKQNGYYNNSIGITIRYRFMGGKE